MNNQKIIVTEEVFEELKNMEKYDKGYLVYHMAKKSDFMLKNYPYTFNELDFSDFYDALHVGYKLRFTKEQKFMKEYNIQKNFSEDIDYEKYKELHLNVMLGMRMAYKILLGKEMEDK